MPHAAKWTSSNAHLGPLRVRKMQETGASIAHKRLGLRPALATVMHPNFAGNGARGAPSFVGEMGSQRTVAGLHLSNHTCPPPACPCHGPETMAGPVFLFSQWVQSPVSPSVAWWFFVGRFPSQRWSRVVCRSPRLLRWPTTN